MWPITDRAVPPTRGRTGRTPARPGRRRLRRGSRRADGTHHLVGVTLGLFDDDAGLVQVTGTGLAAGQRVVVPSS